MVYQGNIPLIENFSLFVSSIILAMSCKEIQFGSLLKGEVTTLGSCSALEECYMLFLLFDLFSTPAFCTWIRYFIILQELPFFLLFHLSSAVFMTRTTETVVIYCSWS